MKQESSHRGRVENPVMWVFFFARSLFLVFSTAFLVVALFFFHSYFAHATPPTTGYIKLTVNDTNNFSLPGVDVQVSCTEKGTWYDIGTTDEGGNVEANATVDPSCDTGSTVTMAIRIIDGGYLTTTSSFTGSQALKYNSNIDPEDSETFVDGVNNTYSLVMNSIEAGNSDGTYLGEYWNNPGTAELPDIPQRTPDFTRDESMLNYNWNEGSPDDSINDDNFSDRHSQTVDFTAGSYTFTVQSDDGSRVYLDGALIIDDWFDQGLGDPVSTTTSISAGDHVITVEHYENGGGAGLIFSYAIAAPEVVSINSDPDFVLPSENGKFLAVEVVFDRAMNTNVAPTLTFSTDMTGYLTPVSTTTVADILNVDEGPDYDALFANGSPLADFDVRSSGWQSDNETYVAVYRISALSAGVGLDTSEISIGITDAVDSYGNTDDPDDPANTVSGVFIFATAVTTITDCDGLQAMSNNLLGTYVLGNDIDCSETKTWNDGAGFVPIGDSDTPFGGTFDGQGHTIHNLYINAPTSEDVALFGNIDHSTIANVVLDGNAAAVSGESDVGALVGEAGNSLIIDATSTISVTVSSNGGTAGGLIGYTYESSVVNDVTEGNLAGAVLSGGLVGFADTGTSITGSHATGNVSGGPFATGGLVGYVDDTTISTSYATGIVSGLFSVGGLVGDASDDGGLEVSDSFSTSPVYGYEQVGGLVGYLAPNGDLDASIINSYTTGTVFVSFEADLQFPPIDFGGLVGNANNAEITDSYATGLVGGFANIGGLVGNSDNTTIFHSFSTSPIFAFVEDAGALVGTDNGDQGFEGSSVFIDDWYDDISAGSIIGQLFCDGSLSGSADGCTAVNTSDDPDPTYFFNTTTSPPFVNGDIDWDFSSIWQVLESSFPILQSTPLLTPPFSVGFVSPTPGNNSTVMDTNFTVAITPSSVVPTYDFTNFNHSLLGWWKFEGDYHDSSGNGNDGTPNNLPSPGLGAFGSSFAFYGGFGVSTVPHLLDNLSAFTISAWISPSSIGTNEGIIGQDGVASVGFDDAGDLIASTTAAGTISWLIDDDVLNNSNWHLVTLVGDMSSSTPLALYLDGNLVASGGTQATDFGSSDNDFNIGENVLNQDDVDSFIGSIDEVMAFSRALAPDEIESLYNADANPYSHTFSNLSNGTYDVQAYSANTSGASTTLDRTITVDTDEPLTPDTVYVNSSYTSDGDNDGHTWQYDAFDNIPDAIAEVNAGGTVNVAAGNYVGENPIEITKSALIISGPGKDAEDQALVGNIACGDVFDLADSSTTIQGLTIFSGGNFCYNGFGVDVQGAEEPVINNLITDNNIFGLGTGVLLTPASASTTVSNNNIYNTFGGIDFAGSSYNTIIGNQVHDNEIFGIFVEDGQEFGDGMSSYNIFSGNTIYNNSAFGIDFETAGGANVVSGNTIHDNGEVGIYQDDGNDDTYTGNELYENGISGDMQPGAAIFIQLDNSDNNVIQQNNVHDNYQYGIIAVANSEIEHNGFTLDDNTIMNNGTSTEFDQFAGPSGIVVCGDYVEVARNTITSNKQNGLELACNSSHVNVNHNTITDNEGPGIMLDNGGDAITMNYNTISGNQSGLYYFGASDVDATKNYWGDQSGPYDITNPSGTGDSISNQNSLLSGVSSQAIGDAVIAFDAESENPDQMISYRPFYKDQGMIMSDASPYPSDVISDAGFVYGATDLYGATTTQSGPFSFGDQGGSAAGLTSCTSYHFAAYLTSNLLGTIYGPDGTDETGGCHPQLYSSYWTFDESSGQTAHDTSGNNNDASVVSGSPQWVPGKFGNAFDFDGATYLEAGRPVSNDFTICAWIKTTASGEGDDHWESAPILDSEVPGLANDFGFGVDADGHIMFGNGGAFDTTVNGSTIVNDNQWHNVCAVRTQSSGAIQVYVDGNLDGQGDGDTATLDGNSDVRIGWGFDGAAYFMGLIDDLRVYGSALDQDQITQIYNGAGVVEMPTITLNGSQHIIVYQGQTYDDPGATAEDQTDGDITSSITTDNEVDTSQVGTYTVTYNVTNSQDVAAEPVTRTVDVVSTDDTKTTISTDDSADIFVPQSISNATLDVSEFLDGTSATLSGTTTINSSTADGNYIIVIPAGTTMTSAGDTWDGILNLPQAKTADDVSLPTISGMTTKFTLAFEIGLGDTALTFDRGVRIEFIGDSGKQAGWQRGGTFTPITSICASDDQDTGDALADAADCKINSGSDLVVWTKHFTTYSIYNQSSSGGSGGGQSSYSSSSGGSSVIYGCKDPRALNYNYFSSSNPALCKYSGAHSYLTAAVISAVPTPSTHAATTSSLVLKRDLDFGASGADVRSLQTYLISDHAGPASKALAKNGASGFFGILTKDAVKEFQAHVKISPAVGHVGPLTRSYLASHPL